MKQSPDLQSVRQPRQGGGPSNHLEPIVHVFQELKLAVEVAPDLYQLVITVGLGQPSRRASGFRTNT